MWKAVEKGKMRRAFPQDFPNPLHRHFFRILGLCPTYPQFPHTLLLLLLLTMKRSSPLQLASPTSAAPSPVRSSHPNPNTPRTLQSVCLQERRGKHRETLGGLFEKSPPKTPQKLSKKRTKRFRRASLLMERRKSNFQTTPAAIFCCLLP